MDQRVIINRAANALEKLDSVVKAVDAVTAEVADIRKALQGIIPAINQTFTQTNQQLSEAVEVLDAVVKTLGPSVIEAAMVEERQARATAQAEELKARLAEAVSNGTLISVDKVTEGSTIVGKETNVDGSTRHPGRAQVAYQKIKPEFQAKMLGQSAGYTVELEGEGKFEILEIYEQVEKPNVSSPASQAIVEAGT